MSCRDLIRITIVDLLGLVAFTASLHAADWPEPGTHGHYAVLTATPHERPPLLAVDVLFGPREVVDGMDAGWWEMEGRAEDDPQTEPLFVLRALTRDNPLERPEQPLHFLRYQLRLPADGDCFEYRTARDEVLLPPWRDFVRHFIPHAAVTTRFQQRLPETAEYLGHILTLRWTGQDVPWPSWPNGITLRIDRELIVGTGRNFKDREGHRLPQQPERQNYDYVPFVAEDYRVMIDAGINLFRVDGSQQRYVQREPVFYHRAVEGDPPLRYPGDLYRSNYLGPVMFMDEPTIIMVGDPLIHNTLRYFSDATALIPARVRARYEASGNYGSYQLERALQKSGVAFGQMRLQQWDYPAWETIFETAHFQMLGGLSGIVHEGRYQLAPFDQRVADWTGVPRQHTPEQLLRYHFALLRGGTQPHGKFWGTSIYGQCDPQIAPQAVTLAYDLGARYVWFWTSDHDHHLPWPEQLDLARRLQAHAQAHPRRSIYLPPVPRDLAIVVPAGVFPSLENLWWVRELDSQGTGEASLYYRGLMEHFLAACQKAFDQQADFDVLIDSGHPPIGYRSVVYVRP